MYSNMMLWITGDESCVQWHSYRAHSIHSYNRAIKPGGLIGPPHHTNYSLNNRAVRFCITLPGHRDNCAEVTVQLPVYPSSPWLVQVGTRKLQPGKCWSLERWITFGLQLCSINPSTRDYKMNHLTDLYNQEYLNKPPHCCSPPDLLYLTPALP